MRKLRVGTRGSDLALRQTHLVLEQLRQVDPNLKFEIVVINTYGDIASEQPIDRDFPPGGFVSAIEQAVLADEVDFAVHSCKDLPAAMTPGLTIAAIPAREDPADVLITRVPVDLASLLQGLVIGSSSARRKAQIMRFADVRVAPIRGNVPRRLEKLYSGAFDGIVLAAAGLKRLGIRPAHAMQLSLTDFLPSPGQGALAVQAKEASDILHLLAAIEDRDARRCVDAERAFLLGTGSGCHTPVAALAVVEGERVHLRGQLFTDDGSQMAQGSRSGSDPVALGIALAESLRNKLLELPN